MVLTTIASALVGLFGSAMPEITAYAKNRAERKHQIALLQLQSQSDHARSVVDQHREKEKTLAVELEGLYRDATTRHSWRWVDAIYKLTRPGITLLIAGQWALINVAEMVSLMRAHDGSWLAVTMAWSEFDQSVFTAVIMFWFGHRAMMRTNGYATRN